MNWWYLSYISYTIFIQMILSSHADLEFDFFTWLFEFQISLSAHSGLMLDLFTWLFWHTPCLTRLIFATLGWNWFKQKFTVIIFFILVSIDCCLVPQPIWEIILIWMVFLLILRGHLFGIFLFCSSIFLRCHHLHSNLFRGHHNYTSIPIGIRFMYFRFFLVRLAH